jgi:tetratricopeptide (TPR) repeat protein
LRQRGPPRKLAREGRLRADDEAVDFAEVHVRFLSVVAEPAAIKRAIESYPFRVVSSDECRASHTAREFSHPLLAAVVRKPEAELGSALDRLVAAGLLFRRGVPPQAAYLFKHAPLVQDAAYGTLLRERRRALHARIAETLEDQFAEIAENQPELLAHHCTEAGLINRAAGLWGKAGQRLLTLSALAEAMAQLSRALAQIEVLPSTPALRREQIKLQLALVNALMHTKGYAASYAAFNGDAVRELTGQFLALAEKQGASVPLMIAHRILGISLVDTGNIAEGRAHLDRAFALYDPDEHRLLAARFGQHTRLSILAFLSRALWLLGYPEGSRADAVLTVKLAREIGPAGLMYALGFTTFPHVWSGNYETANALADELMALAQEKGRSAVNQRLQDVVHVSRRC